MRNNYTKQKKEYFEMNNGNIEIKFEKINLQFYIYFILLFIE